MPDLNCNNDKCRRTEPDGGAAAEGPLPLTERMRKGTRHIHDKSDKLVNLKLALVLTSRPLYGEAISLFAPIYAKLEEILDRQTAEGGGGHPELRKLGRFLPTLRRVAGFDADMACFLGAEQLAAKARRERGEPPELAGYLARLEELERTDPILLSNCWSRTHTTCTWRYLPAGTRSAER